MSRRNFFIPALFNLAVLLSITGISACTIGSLYAADSTSSDSTPSGSTPSGSTFPATETAVPEIPYGQVYLPPVWFSGPPVYVSGPPVPITQGPVTYVYPPLVNPYPPVVVPGPVIVRSPWRPFLRTFIP